MLQHIIAGIFLTLIGLLLALRPAQVWHVTESWKLLGGLRLSPALLRVLRIVGAALAVTGVLVLCFGH